MRILRALVLIVAIGVGASLFVLLLQISLVVKHVDQELAATFGQLNRAITQIQSTAEEGQKLVHDGRLTADNVNHAAIDERFYFEQQLPELVHQAHAILGNVQTATADLHPLLEETTARTHDLAPLEANAAQLVADADVTVRDPHIAASLTNLEASSAQLAVTGRESAAAMGSVQAIAADVQHQVHAITHPRPLVEIANWTVKAAQVVGAFFHF
jgi:uncharacterized protein YoxC